MVAGPELMRVCRSLLRLPLQVKRSVLLQLRARDFCSWRLLMCVRWPLFRSVFIFDACFSSSSSPCFSSFSSSCFFSVTVSPCTQVEPLLAGLGRDLSPTRKIVDKVLLSIMCITLACLVFVNMELHLHLHICDMKHSPC